MALNNILSSRYQVQTAAGEALAGGSVFLYEPGTTTFITSYRDSGLVTPHQNPVRLSGSGRANIWISRDCDMRINDRNGNLIIEELNANPDALSADESAGLVVNGSFEIDSDANNIPDGWSLVSEAGSSNAIDTTESTDGGQSFRFTSSGSGGGSLTLTEFFPVNDSDNLRVNFDLRSTVAGVRNIVNVLWFDISFVSITTSTIYDSTNNPVTFTEQQFAVVPPANARFAKIQLIGCDPAVATPGSTYYDRVSAFYPALVTGIFDNITIQDNEIITTNLNGDLEIAPNGAGSVNINQAAVVDLTDTNNALNLGTDAPDANAHLALSAGIIQAKTNQTTATNLNINPLGGDTSIGPQSGSGGVSLYVNAALTLSMTAAGIVSVRSLDNLDTGNRQLLFEHADGTLRGRVGQASDTTLLLQNFINSGAVRVIGSNSGGAVTSILTGNPDGSSTMYHAGQIKCQTRVNGVNSYGSINGVLGGTQDSYLRLLTSTGVEVAEIGFASLSAFRIVSRNHGADVVLAGEDIGGTTNSILTGDPDGVTTLYHIGSAHLITRADGVAIRGSLSPTIGGIQDSIVLLEDSAGNDIGWIGFVSETGMTIRSLNHGATISIQAEDAGGVNRFLMSGDPDTDVGLYYAGTEVARTLTAANGGFEVNNTSTGSGFERVLTTSDLGSDGPDVLAALKSSDTSRASTTTLTKDPHLEILALEAGARYKLEVFLLLFSTSSTPDFKFDIFEDGVGTINARYQYITLSNATSVVQETSAGDENDTEIIQLAVSDRTTVHLTGTLYIPGVSTNVFVRWAQNTSNATNTTLEAGSYMILTKLSA